MVDSGEVSGAADGALSTEDKQLLSLLLAGLTDEAIAAHFRISVRTVQRKVHALMEMASVRTRMQLAWEAARQDWLPGQRQARRRFRGHGRRGPAPGRSGWSTARGRPRGGGDRPSIWVSSSSLVGRRPEIH